MRFGCMLLFYLIMTIFDRGGLFTGERRKRPTPKSGPYVYAGDHLISHTAARAVPSAQRDLTSVFGMGTGVTLAVFSPANCRITACGVSRLNRLSRRFVFILAYPASTTTWLVLNALDAAALLRRVNSMTKPNGRLVLVSYAHYCASTSSLSTWWSSRALLYP